MPTVPINRLLAIGCGGSHRDEIIGSVPATVVFRDLAGGHT